MSKTNNLKDFLTDVADAIRAKKGTTALINPQDFSSEIASIEGGGGKIKLPNGTKFGYSFNLDILVNVDTSEIANMSNMFRSLGVTSLDLASFDTSSVTTMKEMFMSSGLISINLSSFDTARVTTMHSMFNSCQKLTSLDLTSFDTSSVTSIEYMFFNCTSLISLDLSSFDTSSMRNFNATFKNCTKLTSLILGSNFFKTSLATSVDFSSCSAWVGESVVTSLVTNSYDRAAAGLSVMTLQLHANTKAALTDEQKAAITAKGYTIA